MSKTLSIALIGCGKMGSAMARGWIDNNTAHKITIIDPNPINSDLTDSSVVEHARYAQSMEDPDILVLAVKPQVMADVCRGLKDIISEKTLILSIAAGQSIQTFQSYFGDTQPIVRAMPNTAAAIGKGMIVATQNASTNALQKSQATAVLEAAGRVEWLHNESLMDAVTALSGSGPAYVFLLIEVLAKAGEKQGLQPDFAMTLARQTVIGAAALVEEEGATPAATLRENVTSPGGTTEAALEVLMGEELQTLFDAALTAATERGKSLNKE